MSEEANVEEAKPTETAKSSSLSKMLLVVVIALISSVGGGVVSWFLISKTTMKVVEAKAEAPNPEKIKTEAVALALEKGAALPLEPFVVNLADSEAARYLRIKVSLMIDDKGQVAEVTANTALQLKVRDVILQTLTQKTSQDLISDEGKAKLRQEIQDKITGYFKKPKLVDVMFTEFVIQL